MGILPWSPDYAYLCGVGKRIIIRDAEARDVPFVAKCVLAAVDLYDFKEESIEKDIAERVCAREDTLYTYRHARIAEVDGEVAGCLVSYDGSAYAEARVITFAMFAEAGREIPETVIETGPGEWYLDSMAIAPEFRCFGLGHVLMQDALSMARERGIGKAALLVECSKPALRDYYARIGFEDERIVDAFGDKYIRMVKSL